MPKKSTQSSPARSKGPQSSSSRRSRQRTVISDQKILRELRGEALDAADLAKQFGLPGHQLPALEERLRLLENRGMIARVRRNRYVLPEKADLFTGVMQFHSNGAAHVIAAMGGQPDLFVRAENTATAMHGDRVVARVQEPAKKALWRPGQPPIAERREGRVIRILERANDRIVGTLQRSKNFFYVVADDPRFVHNLYVPEPRPPLAAGPGDKVVARLEAWPSRHVNPEGKIIEVLGSAGQPGVDMLAIVRKYRLPEKFPADVVREAERTASAPLETDMDIREDRRADYVLTIDPDDARDFDDAIAVERSGSGWNAAIHIADVAHYVRPGTALDREAQARGNSVYLPDRVIPMLPEALSNGACSLRPDEDRHAFSVFAKIDANGKPRSFRFAKTLIRSRKRLTYGEALAILEGPADNELGRRVHEAWALCSKLRRRRFEQGSLDLDFPEVKVHVDAAGKPVRIEKVDNDISHQLVEELMLLANEAVARELRRKKQATVYRVHEQPDAGRLEEFRELAMNHGARCGDLTNRTELQKLLTGIRGQPGEFALKLGLLKSLKRARYSEQPLGHYGLAKSNYLHFTSPIRRYADLVAHRALERQLGVTRKGPDPARLPALAEHISSTERVAADAEKEAVKLKKLEYFQHQIAGRKTTVFPARIIEVRNFGMFVELPEFLLTGLVHVSSLEGDFYVFDPTRGRLQGRRTRRIYEVGQEIEVLVSRVDLFKQQVDFRPVGGNQ